MAKRPLEEQQLERAVRATRPQPAQLPWETGWLAATLGEARPDFWGIRLAERHLQVSGLAPRASAACHQAAPPTAVQAAVTGAAYEVARRRLLGLTWPEVQERVRQRALDRWRLLLEYAPTASEVGEQLLDLCTTSSPQAARGLLLNVFAAKSASTLDRRAGALLLYVQWHDRTFSDCQALPPQEARVYQYLAALADGDGPASRGDGLVRAFVLAKHLIGLRGVEPVQGSARAQGAAHRAYLRKRPLQQRQVLSTHMVLTLEQLITQAPTLIDRVASGMFVFMLMARARFSDAQGVVELVMDMVGDQGYLETRTRHTKTGTTKEKRTRLLPMAAPAMALGSTAWAPLWLQARADAQVPGLPDGQLLPAPASASTWSQQPLCAGAASKWLRRLLVGAGFSEQEVRLIGTHSLKATALSWCSKYGLEHHERRLLGYHVAACKHDYIFP